MREASVEESEVAFEGIPEHEGGSKDSALNLDCGLNAQREFKLPVLT